MPCSLNYDGCRRRMRFHADKPRTKSHETKGRGRLLVCSGRDLDNIRAGCGQSIPVARARFSRLDWSENWVSCVRRHPPLGRRSRDCFPQAHPGSASRDNRGTAEFVFAGMSDLRRASNKGNAEEGKEWQNLRFTIPSPVAVARAKQETKIALRSTRRTNSPLINSLSQAANARNAGHPLIQNSLLPQQSSRSASPCRRPVIGGGSATIRPPLLVEWLEHIGNRQHVPVTVAPDGGPVSQVATTIRIPAVLF